VYLYGSGQPYACDMCKVRQIGIHPHVHAHTNVQPREYSCTCTCSLSLSLSPSLSPSISLSLSLSLSLSFYIYIYIYHYGISLTHTHTTYTQIYYRWSFPKGPWLSVNACTCSSGTARGAAPTRATQVRVISVFVCAA